MYRVCAGRVHRRPSSVPAGSGGLSREQDVREGRLGEAGVSAGRPCRAPVGRRAAGSLSQNGDGTSSERRYELLRSHLWAGYGQGCGGLGAEGATWETR